MTEDWSEVAVVRFAGGSVRSVRPTRVNRVTFVNFTDRLDHVALRQTAMVVTWPNPAGPRRQDFVTPPRTGKRRATARGTTRAPKVDSPGVSSGNLPICASQGMTLPTAYAQNAIFFQHDHASVKGAARNAPDERDTPKVTIPAVQLLLTRPRPAVESRFAMPLTTRSERASAAERRGPVPGITSRSDGAGLE